MTYGIYPNALLLLLLNEVDLVTLAFKDEYYNCPSFIARKRIRWLKSYSFANHIDQTIKGKMGFLPRTLKLTAKFRHLSTIIAAHRAITPTISRFRQKMPMFA